MTPPTFFPSTTPLFNYLISQPFVFLHYVRTFFLPTALSADTDWEVLQSIVDYRFFIGTAFVIVTPDHRFPYLRASQDPAHRFWHPVVFSGPASLIKHYPFCRGYERSPDLFPFCGIDDQCLLGNRASGFLL